MRTAEVTINTTMTFRANDRDRKAFKLACVERGEDMAEVLRRCMREYVAKANRK